MTVAMTRPVAHAAPAAQVRAVEPVRETATDIAPDTASGSTLARALGIVLVLAVVIVAGVVVYHAVFDFLISDAGQAFLGNSALIDPATYTGTPPPEPVYDVYNPRVK